MYNSDPNFPYVMDETMPEVPNAVQESTINHDIPTVILKLIGIKEV